MDLKNVKLFVGGLDHTAETVETRHNFNTVHVTCVVRLDQQSSAIPFQGLVLGNQWRDLENMKAQFVAVNGIRKVACVVCSFLHNASHFVWAVFSFGYNL